MAVGRLGQEIKDPVGPWPEVALVRTAECQAACSRMLRGATEQHGEPAVHGCADITSDGPRERALGAPGMTPAQEISSSGTSVGLAFLLPYELVFGT